MRHEIVREIAMFRDGLEYQVEMWDRALIEYFAARADRFHQFKHGSESERHQAWFDGYRHSRGMAVPAH